VSYRAEGETKGLSSNINGEFRKKNREDLELKPRLNTFREGMGGQEEG